jgi:hypothetical protein
MKRAVYASSWSLLFRTLHCIAVSEVMCVLQARLLLTWASQYGTEPDDRVCSDTKAVASITAASQDWMTVGMKELFRASNASHSASNVALLWAVKGPDFDLKGALTAAKSQNSALADQLSLTRLVQGDTNQVSILPEHRPVA